MKQTFQSLLMIISVCKIIFGLVAELISVLSGSVSMHAITVIEGAVLFIAALYYEQLLKKDSNYQEYVEPKKRWEI